MLAEENYGQFGMSRIFAAKNIFGKAKDVHARSEIRQSKNKCFSAHVYSSPKNRPPKRHFLTQRHFLVDFSSYHRFGTNFTPSLQGQGGGGGETKKEFVRAQIGGGGGGGVKGATSESRGGGGRAGI